MKDKTIEVKIPINVISKVEEARKAANWYGQMDFSDYLSMIILRAVDYEKERYKNFNETLLEDEKVILFPNK